MYNIYHLSRIHKVYFTNCPKLKNTFILYAWKHIKNDCIIKNSWDFYRLSVHQVDYDATRRTFVSNTFYSFRFDAKLNMKVSRSLRTQYFIRFSNFQFIVGNVYYSKSNNQYFYDKSQSNFRNIIQCTYNYCKYRIILCICRNKLHSSILVFIYDR